jgi:predicted RNA binding protein YcfA (HicA-like mRNA interferase family)
MSGKILKRPPYAREPFPSAPLKEWLFPLAKPALGEAEASAAKPGYKTSAQPNDPPLLVCSLLMNCKQVIRKLENAGWRLKRIRGSHHLMEKDGKSVPVPVHGNADLGKGLLADLERQTGVSLK